MYSSAAGSEVQTAPGTQPVIDLRSDTVTRPSPEMRRAMAEAEVGDDVYLEDPTVNRLEKRAAEIFGKESALFVPSGCMGNLISIKVWTNLGDEVVCEERSHVNLYELASMSAIAGCMPRVARGDDGILNWKQIEAVIRPKIYYDSQTALICLENTHNRGGGRVFPLEKISAIHDWARQNGLAMHLDGAVEAHPPAERHVVREEHPPESAGGKIEHASLRKTVDNTDGELSSPSFPLAPTPSSASVLARRRFPR